MMKKKKITNNIDCVLLTWIVGFGCELSGDMLRSKQEISV